ncbi:hypothetical protein [Actinokineospora sp. HUAS TT18]|uniref:hypothetical protein n=1 Tax=Actinokineospora sp. HUAS TT18 TaxID=3447451 RepID=UPI003F51DEDF
MSQPTPTSVPVPDELTMKRLGYMKLFHQQATTQSFAPPPLNFSAVSMFYDVMELFFVIAMGHYCAQDNVDLSKPFSNNLKVYIAPDGAKLSSREAERRLSSVRHSFKHDGAVPNSDQIEQARRDTAVFLENNCHRVFGVQYADISMLHIVPQDIEPISSSGGLVVL